MHTEKSPTLKASQKESVALGFMAGQSADAGSTGAEIELSPTLRSSSSGTNQAPTVVTLMGEVGNGATDEDLWKAREKLFEARDVIKEYLEEAQL